MIYTIHMHPRARPHPLDTMGASRFDGVVAVPEALAKWAVIAPPLWLARYRLWWPLAFYLLTSVFVLKFLSTPYAILALYLGGLPGLYLLVEGHQLRRYKLQRQGLDTVAIVDAVDERHAIERFIADWKPPAEADRRPLANLPGSEQSDDASIGLFADMPDNRANGGV